MLNTLLLQLLNFSHYIFFFFFMDYDMGFQAEIC